MSFADIEALIPHRLSMRLVDSVSDYSGGTGEVRIRVDKQKPYFKSGKFGSIWTVELMAQAVAAIYGLSDSSGKPKVGYLISVDSYQLESNKIVEEGDELVVKIKSEHLEKPIGIYSAEVFFRGEIYSTGRFKAFLTDREIA